MFMLITGDSNFINMNCPHQHKGQTSCESDKKDSSW